MSKLEKLIASLGLILLFSSQVALADSATYHLKKLEIQARSFLSMLDSETRPSVRTGDALEAPEDSQAAHVNLDLERTVHSSSWAENMAREDLQNLLATSEVLIDTLAKSDAEEYLKAKIELESLARRLRISTSPLTLTTQQQTSLELVMLELEETTAILNEERQQKIAAKDSQRRRTSVSVGLGYGYGGWGPWGYNGWGAGFYNPYFGNTGFYRPYRGYRGGRRCR